jgi:hypothetical protein
VSQELVNTASAALPVAPTLQMGNHHLTCDDRDSERMARFYGGGATPNDGVVVYRNEQAHLVVIATLDRTERFGTRLHVSISFKDRYPSWREIKELKATFFGPHVAAAMILPEDEHYVNVGGKNVFHLWEIPGGWGIQ